ncbi:insecticidal delta-endotoxin Cry8Ea1 family protein [Sodalis praecaptivus]|nr:insecticidal delta-endotoxin Cry8Ea1 family protein [Sodalis praecaptivus]
MNDKFDSTAASSAVTYHPAIENPLVATGIILQFAADFIPYVGGIISTVIALLWPKSQEDAWTQIKEKVKALVNEEIDNEEWNVLKDLVDEFEDKVSEFSQALSAGNYESAKIVYSTLTVYFIGIDERFKIQGQTLGYTFAPLYCTTVSLILAFRLEVIQHASQLKLDQELIDTENTRIRNLALTAIDYIEKITETHEKYVIDKLSQQNAGDSADNKNMKSINNIFQFNQYYLTNVVIFSQIWGQFKQHIMTSNPIIALTFPGMAAGIFYKIQNDQPVALDGAELATIITPASEAAVITAATLYDTIEFSDEYVRPTAAKVVYTDHQDNMGYFGRPNDLQVAPHAIDFDENDYDYLNSISASMFEFVGRATVTSAKGTSISAGKQNDPDVMTLKLECPYRIALIYVPDDEIGYDYLQSGHQMSGIACGVVYDNTLSAAYAKAAQRQWMAK